MGNVNKVQPVKLIFGEIFASEQIVTLGEDELIKEFGNIDFQSATIRFDFTDYYNKEMAPKGELLFRRWLSFENLINPEKLAEIKLKSNQLELKFAINNNRRINLDPGYVSGASLILASTKNYSHRIYLQYGIYAEVTLIYENGTWIDLKWTYPDYRTETAKKFFSEVRNKYLEQIKKCSQYT